MKPENFSKLADWTTIICGPLSLILPIVLELSKHYMNAEEDTALNSGYIAFAFGFLAFFLFFAFFIKVPKMLEGLKLDMELFQLKWMCYIAFGVFMLFAITWFTSSVIALDTMSTGDRIALIVTPLIAWLLFGFLYLLNKI